MAELIKFIAEDNQRTRQESKTFMDKRAASHSQTIVIVKKCVNARPDPETALLSSLKKCVNARPDPETETPKPELPVRQ